MKVFRPWGEWCTAAGLWLLMSMPAGAAVVGVRVMDAVTGKPVEDAAVCVGTPAEPGQFGAVRTGPDGRVQFADIPYAPLQVTVSRAGYRGVRERYPPADFDRVLQVRLHPGGLGPQCRASVRYAPPPARKSGLAVDILAGPTPVTHEVQLRIRVQGKATHYRISEDPDFRGAAWLPYTKAPVTFRLSPSRGDKTLYVQVRLQRKIGEGTVEIDSEVIRVPVHDTGS